MTGLLAFLNARLDDDERVARAAAPGPWQYQDIESVGGGRVCDPTVAIAQLHFDAQRVDPRIRRSVWEEEADATGEHIARHDPARVLREVAAKRLVLAEWQRDLAKRTEIYAKPDTELHALRMHPDYEYATTEGQRKAWDYSDVPPDGEGWERNVDAGMPGEGWERFEYTEESYWRRRMPEGERSIEPTPPLHIRALALPFDQHPDYDESWRP